MKLAMTLVAALAVLSGCAEASKLIGKTLSGEYSAVCTFAKDGKLVGTLEGKANCPQAADGSLDTDNCDVKGGVK